MPREKFKIIKDFGNTRKSERRKYLETMMAQMGLTSLDELRSDEERRRWIKAVTPQPIVEKKLKEMGYSIFSNTNKRSLGFQDRSANIYKLYKIANVSAATDELIASMREIKTKLKPDTIYKIMGTLSNDKLRSKDFDSDIAQTEIESFVVESEENPDFFKFFIGDLVEKASKYNSEYLKSTETFAQQDKASLLQTMLSDPALEIKRRHADHDQVAFIQQKLEDLEYILKNYGVDGKFGSETESVVILFQQEHNLTVNGVVDAATFKTLIETKEKRVQQVEQVADIVTAPVAISGQAVTLAGLSNVEFVYKERTDIKGASPMLHEYLKILNQVAAENDSKIQITSVFRDSYNQARIMLNNYNSRKGGKRAGRYLSRLYNKFRRIDDIVAIYSSSRGREEKIKAAENIIETSWSKTGHRGGKSIDVRLGRKVRRILKQTQRLATVSILRESDHFHVTIKSLDIGPKGKNRIRRFRG